MTDRTRQRMLETVGAEFCFGDPDAPAERALMLIHGVIGGPLQVRELGERAHRVCGHDAYGFLLPAHCAGYDPLAAVKYPRWTASVEKNYLKLKERYRHVDVCGFSLGGVLSLDLARKHRIPNLALLAAPMWYTHDKLPLESLVRKSHRLLPKLPAPQVSVAVSHADGGRVVAKIPTEKFFPPHLLYQLMLIMRTVRESVSKARCDRALVVQSKADPWAAPRSGAWIHDNLECKDKQLKHLRFAYHEFLVGRYKDIVINHVLDFLRGAENH